MMSDNSMGNYENLSYGGEGNSIKSSGDLVNQLVGA